MVTEDVEELICAKRLKNTLCLFHTGMSITSICAELLRNTNEGFRISYHCNFETTQVFKWTLVSEFGIVERNFLWFLAFIHVLINYPGVAYLFFLLQWALLWNNLCFLSSLYCHIPWAFLYKMKSGEIQGSAEVMKLIPCLQMNQKLIVWENQQTSYTSSSLRMCPMASRRVAYFMWIRIPVKQQYPLSRALLHSPIQSVTHTSKEALTLFVVCWSCCALHGLGNFKWHLANVRNHVLRNWNIMKHVIILNRIFVCK